MVLCAVMDRNHEGCIREPHQDCTDPGERTKARRVAMIIAKLYEKIVVDS